MYSKEEASQIRRKFWISFGHFMKLQPTASGLPVNWINYKTEIKSLNFKTDVDNKTALVRIEMNDADVDIQHLMYEQFEEYKILFESYLGGQWFWNKDIYDEYGKQVCRIESKLGNVSIFREEDWSMIIEFLKDKLAGLDAFWYDAKHSFDIFK